MKAQIRKILKEQGFVVGTPEWKKEYARIRHKTRNPEYLERRRKKRLASNLPEDKLEQQRKLWRERKARKRAKQKEEINRLQREYYERNKERLRTKIYEGRTRRDPSRGLTKLIDSFRRGHVGYDEVVRQFRTAIVQSHALTDGRARAEVSRRRKAGRDEI